MVFIRCVDTLTWFITLTYLEIRKWIKMMMPPILFHVFFLLWTAIGQRIAHANYHIWNESDLFPFWPWKCTKYWKQRTKLHVVQCSVLCTHNVPRIDENGKSNIRFVFFFVFVMLNVFIKTAKQISCWNQHKTARQDRNKRQ